MCVWGGGDGALWPRTAMSIHRAFYHPLIQRSGSLVATRHRGQGVCDGPRWWVEDREGGGLVEAWWETTDRGLDGSRPVSPVGRGRL